MQRLKAHLLTSAVLLPLALVTACASGKRWVMSPAQSSEKAGRPRLMEESENDSPPKKDVSTVRIGPRTDQQVEEHEYADAPGERPVLKLTGVKQVKDGPVDGRLAGVFRNTYYDFPNEVDFSGPATPLMNQECKVIRRVPRGFHEAVCVQGSGILATGTTVSFAKRNCRCARTCTKTGQRICFDALDRRRFPWGRGAQGKPIVPLRSVAVDSDVIPLGTPIYILELDGIPRKPGGVAHDGCFVADDRGMNVQGKHVDIFTGNAKVTAHFNSVVPSNTGVHVYIGTARCQ